MILESIAVISAANAAISTIKEAIGNGKDLMAQLTEVQGISVMEKPEPMSGF